MKLKATAVDGGYIRVFANSVLVSQHTMARFLQGGYATTITSLNLKIEKLECAVVNNMQRFDELRVEAWKCRDDSASLTTQVSHLLNQ